uniref:Uncharacterized protein n=1 Tax=Anopheles atroparvus TaxID=41427 RepID=A0A182IND5_ANOAO
MPWARELGRELVAPIARKSDSLRYFLWISWHTTPVRFVIATVVAGGARPWPGAVPVATVDPTTSVCLGRVAPRASVRHRLASVRWEDAWQPELEDTQLFRCPNLPIDGPGVQIVGGPGWQCSVHPVRHGIPAIFALLLLMLLMLLLLLVLLGRAHFAQFHTMQDEGEAWGKVEEKETNGMQLGEKLTLPIQIRSPVRPVPGLQAKTH